MLSAILENAHVHILANCLGTNNPVSCAQGNTREEHGDKRQEQAEQATERQVDTTEPSHATSFPA